jgi:hypothetical protein
MLEKRIENRLKILVTKAGGKAVKFVSPGNAGVNDRLILLPGKRMFMVELKAPGKKRSPLQEKWARDMESLDFTVYCLDTIEAVDQFIWEFVKERQWE